MGAKGIKRSLYYGINLAFVLLSFILSYILYFVIIQNHSILQALKRSYYIIKGNHFRFFFVVITVFFFAYLLEIIDYNAIRYRRKKRSVIYIKFIFVYSVVIILDFFFFYSVQLGRMVYLSSLVILILFYLLFDNFNSSRLNKVKNYFVGAKDNLNQYSGYLDMSRIQFVDLKEKFSNKDKKHIIYDINQLNQYDMLNILKMKIGGSKIEELIHYIEMENQIIPIDLVGNRWLLNNIFRSNRLGREISNKISWVISLFSFLITFPIGLIFSIFYKIESKGSIFFRQQRVGKNNKIFTIIKFRTMNQDAEVGGAQFTKENDPRVSKIGRIMRKFRIDEIPQLINVLKGDMNLIGPRPERDVFISKLEKEIPFYRLRLELKPGLTGWAQVNCNYAGDKLEDHYKKLEYDLYYIKNQNLSLDLIILIKTVKSMLWAKGM